MGAPDPGHDTRTYAPDPAEPGEGERFYLVVVREGSSSRFELPGQGLVTLGRAPECDLCIDEASLSRRHARLLLADCDLRIVDLDSRNGTRVNGVELSGASPLVPGDVISMGSITVILCQERHGQGAHELLGPEELRPYLRAEADRALHFQRSVAVITLVPGARVDRERLKQEVLERLRRTDQASWFDPEHLILVLPECGEDDAVEVATELLAATRESCPEGRAGVAAAPDDGCDGETLLAASRAAAEVAIHAQVRTSRSTAARLDLQSGVIVADPVMHRLYELIRRLASSDLPVLVTGETGTGKELAAQAVHAWSPRASKPFVVLNCAAIQDTLIESELFGYERGAFSGAVTAKPGLLETARGGTVFLDEIGELSSGAQAKLLRALESGRFTRVGDIRERQVDIRLVAATNRSLETEVAGGRFRQDLFFRLGAATVVLPPLRDRPREIPLLARAFLEEACARGGRPVMSLSIGAVQALATRGWAGNVRELRNLMRFLAATAQGEVVQPWHLTDRPATSGELRAEPSGDEEALEGAAPLGRAEQPRAAGVFKPLADELRELELLRIMEALEAAGGVQKEAAKLLCMPLRTFGSKVRQYGLNRGPQSP